MISGPFQKNYPLRSNLSPSHIHASSTHNHIYSKLSHLLTPYLLGITHTHPHSSLGCLWWVVIERYLGPAPQWLCQKDVSASALMTETLPAKEDHYQFGNIQVRGIYTFKGKSSSYWSESQFSHFLAGCLWQVIYLFNSLICKLRIPTAVGCCEIKNKVCLALKCCRTLSSFILSTLSLLLVFQMQSPWCSSLRDQDRLKEPQNSTL